MRGDGAAVKDGELDACFIPDKPLDVLAAADVAASGRRGMGRRRIVRAGRRAYLTAAWKRRSSTRSSPCSPTAMHKRGQRAALVHYDAVHRKLRERRGSRMIAIMSGRAIRGVRLRVRLEPEGLSSARSTRISASNRCRRHLPARQHVLGILQMATGVVRVADAQGSRLDAVLAGEAPSRSDEMSAASRGCAPPPMRGSRRPISRASPMSSMPRSRGSSRTTRSRVLLQSRSAAYLAEGKRALGVVPTAETLVLERFFDEAGGMQLVLHAPWAAA